MKEYYTPNDAECIAETDSQSIQNAVDAAAQGEIRTVRIPRQCARTGKCEWEIDKTILLPSDITVILDDCHLTLKEGVYENIFRNKNMYTDISLKPEGRQSGIRIIGRGDAVLDGGKGNDLRESTSRKDGRPHVRFNNFVLLHHVTDYVLENFKCVNMRWWAVNQIACQRGKVSNLRFWNGELIPNQDGVNCRIGCSDILIENITGRTGDDVVALSAFPFGTDRELLPEGHSVDIHDITVRNVRANTKQTVVSLRNQDGANMYRITIENIADIGGEYAPWGIVRIGENNYFKKRLSEMGETREICVRGAYSLARGTVFINSTLKDSHISDVYAGGTSMSAVSSYAPVWVSPETHCKVTGGVSLENVVIENVHYSGTAQHPDDPKFSDPGRDFHGCALDFRYMRETDTMKHVVFRDIFAREGADLFLTPEGQELDIRN